MSTRAVHRLRLFGDHHLWHAMVVAATACVLSAGLVYVGYYVHVLRVARRAPCLPLHGQCVLLFGKHAPQGRVDRDFAARLDRAVSLWQEQPPASVVLLGGGGPGEPTEAEVARLGLFARGMAADAPLQLEAASRDTLQNLRNARLLLFAAAAQAPVPADAPAVAAAPIRVTLLSNRYHLARCAMFARQLGFDAELCAAETRLHWGPRTLLRVAGEAAYMCLTDVGTRWARLIGYRTMLERVS
ncbi:MAG: YdcF family protein [Pseudomonadota bacterium]|nr:YdcF family protein [Pseudomonadota bacterium]